MFVVHDWKPPESALATSKQVSKNIDGIANVLGKVRHPERVREQVRVCVAGTDKD